MRSLVLLAAFITLAGCDDMQGQKASELNPERKDYDFMGERKTFKPEYELLDVPVLPGAKPVSETLPMMWVNTAAGRMCSADWTTPMKPEKIIDFYRVSLKESSASKSASGQTLVGKTKGGFDFTLTITEEKGKSRFVITVLRDIEAAKPSL